MAYARDRGAETIVLAGHSNGAVGALRILQSGPGHSQLRGLVLISGFHPASDASTLQLPTLAVSGREDARFSASRLETWAGTLGDGEVVIVPGAGHMLLVTHRTSVDEALTRFLTRVSAAAPRE